MGIFETQCRHTVWRLLYNTIVQFQ